MTFFSNLVFLLLIFYITFFSIYYFHNFKIFKYFAIPILTIINLLYCAETFLNNKKIFFKLINNTNYKIDEKYINELSNHDEPLYPSMIPSNLVDSGGIITHSKTSEKIFPLGGISKSYTLLTNDNDKSDEYIYKTDKYGFNNKQGIWDEDIEILIVGDSFAEGFSVQPKDNIQSKLISSNYNTISLGKGSNGPLIQYASIVEYAKLTKPKYIVWLYFFNDLSDLNSELNSKLLNQYITQNNYSQNLFKKQKLIDNLLKSYFKNIQEENKNLTNNFNLNSIKDVYLNMIFLTNLRKKFNFVRYKHYEDDYYEDFKIIIDKTKTYSNSINSTLIFVYLPSFDAINSYKYRFKEDHRSEVLKIVEKLNIEIIDIMKFFREYKDPLSLFRYRSFGHYNEKGYELISEKIVKKIKSFQ